MHAEGLIVRGRWRAAEDRQIEVRIMIPFTLCCTTCKEFSYRGKKFNSKKEIAQDIDYLGISIHRCVARANAPGRRAQQLRARALLPPSSISPMTPPSQPSLNSSGLTCNAQVLHQMPAMCVGNCFPDGPQDRRLPDGARRDSQL